MPLLAFTAMKLEKEIDQTFEDISDNTSEMNTIAQENLAGVRLVKAFAVTELVPIFLTILTLTRPQA